MVHHHLQRKGCWSSSLEVCLDPRRWKRQRCCRQRDGIHVRYSLKPWPGFSRYGWIRSSYGHATTYDGRTNGTTLPTTNANAIVNASAANGLSSTTDGWHALTATDGLPPAATNGNAPAADGNASTTDGLPVTTHGNVTTTYGHATTTYGHATVTYGHAATRHATVTYGYAATRHATAANGRNASTTAVSSATTTIRPTTSI